MRRDDGFDLGSLRPGKLTVTLRRAWDERPLLVVRDVVVEAGKTTRDPRLLDVDLEALLPLRRVTVRTAAGEPAVGAWVHYRASDTRAGWDTARVLGGGEARFRCHGAGADLVVLFDGHVADARREVGTRASAT